MTTVSLLFLSNIFMTIAWYGHLKNLPLKLDDLWAGICLVGGSHVMFRSA